MRWATLGALVVVFVAAVTALAVAWSRGQTVAAVTALAVAWSRGQTAATVTAAGAITVQIIGGVLAAVRKGMFGSAQEAKHNAYEDDNEEEPPSAQLTLVLNEG